MERANVSGWVIAIIAIAALVLMLALVRGTQAHSRYAMRRSRLISR